MIWGEDEGERQSKREGASKRVVFVAWAGWREMGACGRGGETSVESTRKPELLARQARTGQATGGGEGAMRGSGRWELLAQAGAANGWTLAGLAVLWLCSGWACR